MLSVIVACIIIVVDQISKVALCNALPVGDRTELLGNVLRFTHVRNSGAIFGVMRDSGTYFTVFSIAAAGVLVAVLVFSKKARLGVKVGLGLVLGGAVGNLIDRLRFGAVIDFIDVGIGERVRWPSFNIADLAITVGVIWIVYCYLRSSD